MAHRTSNNVITRRPPKRSVQMPSGKRKSAPVKTGIAVSSPNSVPFSLSSVRSSMPITPNIIQTTKQTHECQRGDAQNQHRTFS